MGAGKFAVTEVFKKRIINKVLDGARAGVVDVISILELKTDDIRAGIDQFRP